MLFEPGRFYSLATFAHEGEFIPPPMTLGVELVTLNAKSLKTFPKHATALIGG